MNKKAIAVGIGLLSVGSVFAAVLLASLPATVTVSEAITVTTTSVSVSAFPGETQCQSVSVTNAASVPLNVNLAFSEGTNSDGVVYTTNAPFTDSVAAGATESEDVCFTIASDSPIGTFDGTVAVSRTA